MSQFCCCLFVDLQLLHQAQVRSRSCSGFRRYSQEVRDLLLTRSAPGGSVASQTPLPCRPSSASPRPGRGQAREQRNPPCLPPASSCLRLSPRAGRQIWFRDSSRTPHTQPGAQTGLQPGRGGMCCHRKMHPCLEILTEGIVVGPFP